MGKGTIRENLGDGHYRVALDIDVSYAREQLASIQQYLAEFQPTYQEAIDRKDQAKAAIEPINTRLHHYLATAQAESETAYAALQSAYAFWQDLLAAQPAGEEVSFLRQALTDASQAFDEAHSAYHDARLNRDNPDLPSPAAAWQRRNDALLALAVAQGQWVASVGPIEDESAVNEAYDLVGVAVDNFDSATLAYAEAVEALSSDQAMRLSAMNFYQGEFNTAQGEWIKTVEDNSGLIFLKRARAAYDQATADFEAKQQALASLLDNGGMPAELAAIQADLEKAHQDFSLALDEVQSLTLLKTEKQTARDYLLSKLLPVTESDGLTPKPPIVNAWCADLTDTLSPQTPVATVEIPGERQLGVRIRPQFGGGNEYTARRDGQLQPAFASSPEATFWNWALHPGAEKWRPRYRLGRIIFLDPAAETCTVVLDPQKTGASTRARDGMTLDANTPIKTLLDPQSGQQHIILPGPNLQVQNGMTTLLKVPIQYMDCGADAFEVNDHVLVEFTDRQWTQPRIIGFADNPKPCVRAGLILTGIPEVTGVREGLYLRDVPKGGDGKLIHPSGGGVTRGGNLDWVSADGKTTLTWKGPPGRAIAPTILPGAYDPATDFAAEAPGWRHRFRMQFGSETPQSTSSDGAMFVRTSSFGSAIYLNGKTEIIAPARHYILGAGVCRYEGPDNTGKPVTKSYLVAVFCGSLSLDWADHEERYQCWDVSSRPHIVNPVFAYATLEGTTIGPWHILHTEDLAERGDVMPPVNAVFFSGKGTQCATGFPTLCSGLITHEYDGGSTSEELSYQVGNDLILRARWQPGLMGVTLASVTRETQGKPASTYTSDHTKTGPSGHDYGAWSFDETTTHSGHSHAILAIDYIGEQEVTLEVTASRQSQSQRGGSGFSVEAGADGDHGRIESNSSESISLVLLDTHRQQIVGDYGFTRGSNGSEDWQGSEDAMPWTVSQGSTRSASCHRPYYYDLRTGAVLWYSGSGSTVTTSGHASDLVVGGDTYWEGSDQQQITTCFEDRDGNTYSQTTDALFNAIDGKVNGTPTYQGSGVEGSWRQSASGNPAQESGCNQARAQHLSRWEPDGYSWSPVQVMPVIHAQGCNKTGDIVCRIDFRACPKVDQNIDSVYWRTDNRIDFSRLHHYLEAFSTAFDLDQAWMTHLSTYHRPQDGSDIPQQTAVEAGLVPEFRR